LPRNKNWDAAFAAGILDLLQVLERHPVGCAAQPQELFIGTGKRACVWWDDDQEEKARYAASPSQCVETLLG
jgi:hypothetical protein